MLGSLVFGVNLGQPEGGSWKFDDGGACLPWLHQHA